MLDQFASGEKVKGQAQDTRSVYPYLMLEQCTQRCGCLGFNKNSRFIDDDGELYPGHRPRLQVRPHVCPSMNH